MKKTKWKENEKIEFYCEKTKKWSKGRIIKARVFTEKGWYVEVKFKFADKGKKKRVPPDSLFLRNRWNSNMEVLLEFLVKRE